LSRSFFSKSPESYAVGSAIVAVLMAAVLTRTPAAAFGTFWQMIAILLGADIVVYVMMKLGWIKLPRARS
jgi:predicted permease